MILEKKRKKRDMNILSNRQATLGAERERVLDDAKYIGTT